MNSIPCSRRRLALLSLVVLVATAGTAAAFQVSAEGVPSESLVGSEVSATYTIEDPFTGTAEEYRLRGETELTNVSWTVTVYRAGSQVSQSTYGTQNFTQQLRIANNGDEVKIELAGTTPGIENFTYEPAESYVFAELTRVTGNNPTVFRNDTVHHYTTDSREARQAIEAADNAIENASGVEDARRLMGNAISAYESEDFTNAVDLAEQSESQAESAQSAAQRNQLILMGVGALVVIGLVVGGYLYWRSQQDDYSKL